MSSALRQLAAVLPILGWIRSYRGADAGRDLLAGVTVGVLLVPQGMAYAVLAGLEPIYGLYASLIPLLVYPLFTSAQGVAFGIVAIDMLIVGSAIARLGITDPAAVAGVAVLLALMAGAAHIVLGVLRLGWVVAWMSRPVVTGFMIAAPLLIASSQVGNLLGVPWPRLSTLIDLGTADWTAVASPVALAAVLGCVAIVLLILGRRFTPRIPVALVVIVVATVLAWHGDLDGVALVGAVPERLPRPGLPATDFATVRALIGTAVSLVLIQLMTVVTIGRSVGDGGREEVDPDRELIAIGAANLAGGLFQSPPVSASLSRSGLNAQTGGRTPLVNVVAAGVVAAGLLFLAPVLALVPLPALAAIIVVSAIGMIDVGELRTLFTIRRRDGGVAVATAILTLLLGIQEGVLLGVGATLLIMLAQASRPRVVELGRLPDGSGYRDVEFIEHAERVPELLILRVDGSLNFANADYVIARLVEALDAADDDVTGLVLDGRGINSVDASAVEALSDLAASLEERGVGLYLSHFKRPARGTLVRAGLLAAAVNADAALFPEAIVQRHSADSDPPLPLP